MILGIDISTSITGFAVIDPNGNIVLSSACDLRRDKDFFSKCITIKFQILSLLEQYGGKIKHIYIEEPFTFFNSGGSSAKTMAALQRFNGVVSWMVFECFEIKPQYIEAKQARKLVGIKVPRGQKAKKVVMEHLLRTEPDFKIELTHKGNPRPQEYDRADALVIARAGLQSIWNEKIADEE